MVSKARHNPAIASAFPTMTSDPLDAIIQACDQLAKTEVGDIHKLSKEHHEMALGFYEDVRRQAQRSFIAALVSAGVGTVFFGIAAWTMMQSRDIANISLIAGVLIQVISGINFYLYGRTSRQFSSFHVCLERTTRFLMVYNMTMTMSGEARDAIQKDVICIMANAPMLSVDGGKAQGSATS